MKDKNNRKPQPPRVEQVLNVSTTPSPTDPLGSYTGIPNPEPCMPRKTVGGKIYLKIPEKPTQDVDDL